MNEYHNIMLQYSIKFTNYLSEKFGYLILPKEMTLYHLSKNKVELATDIMDMYFHPSEGCILRNGYNYETQFRLTKDIKVIFLLSSFNKMKMKCAKGEILYIIKRKLTIENGYVSSTGSGEGLFLKLFNISNYLEKTTDSCPIKNSWLILNKNDHHNIIENSDRYIYPSYFLEYPIILYLNNSIKESLEEHIKYMKRNIWQTTFTNILDINNPVYFPNKEIQIPMYDLPN